MDADLSVRTKRPDLRQEELRGRLAALGFDEVRFATLAELRGDKLRGWLDAGYHGEMQWMERTAEKRLRPELVLPGARSVIMLGVSYWNEAWRKQPERSNAGQPVWARYALHEDYHDTIKPALVAAGRAIEELYGAEEKDYRYYVDTGPVLERGWAARAGLGFIGKNAMLISRRHGNWLFLASILTTVEFAADEPVRKKSRRKAGWRVAMGSDCCAGNVRAVSTRVRRTRSRRRGWWIRGDVFPTRRSKTKA